MLVLLCWLHYTKELDNRIYFQKMEGNAYLFKVMVVDIPSKSKEVQTTEQAGNLMVFHDCLSDGDHP